MLKETLKNVQAILWDIDGTIFSSEDIIGPSYVQSFQDFQAKNQKEFPIPQEDDIMKHIGKPVREIFCELVPSLSLEEREEISDMTLKILIDRIYAGKGKFYQDAQKTLHSLATGGYRFFSASNGRYLYIEAVLKQIACFDLFENIQVVDYQRINNKSDIVKETLQNYSIHPNEAVLIGDRLSDRNAAFDNKVPFIATAYGHGSPKEWKDACLVIESISELSSHLAGATETM